MTNLEYVYRKRPDWTIEALAKSIYNMGQTCEAGYWFCGSCIFHGICKEAPWKIEEWLKQEENIE